MNFTTIISESAVTHSNKIAIQEGLKSISYVDLDYQMKALAHQLERSGIKAGMGVAIMGKNSIDFVQLALAVLHTGAVLIPLDDNLRQAEIHDVLQKIHIHSILTLNRKIEIEEYSHSTSLPGFDSIQLFKQLNTTTPFCDQLPDAAYMRFTSGTTGQSKGVILTHSDIEERTRSGNKALGLNSNDTVLWVLSMAYHFVASILLYLRYGCTIVVHNDFSAPTILQAINQHKVTFLYFSPLFIRILASETRETSMPTVNKVISTSTGLDKQLGTVFYEKYTIPVTQVYGIIELGLPVINLKEALTHPGSIGYASPEFKVDILDDHGVIIPVPNRIGQLAIRGPGMCSAYLHPFTPREEMLQHGYFLTGDLASKNKDGLITIKGRLKSMINVAGNKVFPEEVEAVILTYPGIDSCRVYGATHQLLGESVVADIRASSIWQSEDKENLIRYCRKQLSRHKIPTLIQQVDDIQQTGSGKIKRG